MNTALKKLARKLDGAIRQINVGLRVDFEKTRIDEEKLFVNLGFVYAGTQGAMTVEIDDQNIILLVMHVIDTRFPFINVVVAFDEFTNQLPKEEGRVYFKDAQGYLYSDEVNFFAAGNKFSYQGELTEVGLLEYIRKTIVFSYEFDKKLQNILYKRPRPVKHEQVSEEVRYILVHEGLQKANSIGEKELHEREEYWEIMNSFQICNQDKEVVDEVPAIISFNKLDDEMGVEVLIEIKPEIEIEKYQQGAIQLAVQAQASKIDYSDEYIVDEKGMYFKYKLYGNHQYDPDAVAEFISLTAKVAANLITRIN